MGNKKFKSSAAKSVYLGCISMYYHSLHNRLTTGSNWSIPSLNLDEAKPTGAKGQFCFPNSTKARDIDIVV